MIKMLFCLLLLSSVKSGAQNVGIGTPTPAEKLDVSGNINVTGTIKANGADGTPGQVLMKNSSGVLNWGNVGDFKNVATFTDTSGIYINWNVPVDITRVWVELWGGGGAGLFAGGGGGGYTSLLLKVDPGQLLQVTVGQGGKDNQLISGSATFNQSGTGSRLDVDGQYYIAGGGLGAITSTIFSYPQYLAGIGGTYATSISATTSPRGSFYAQAGQTGGIFHYEYNSISTNQYFRLGHYGDGGSSANSGNYTAKGAFEEFSVTLSPAASTRTLHNPARPGVFPGGGGGGGPQLVNDARSGANGLVLIHY